MLAMQETRGAVEIPKTRVRAEARLVSTINVSETNTRLDAVDIALASPGD